MRKKIGLAGLLMLASFCGFEIYHQTGVVHATKKNGFGCVCHSFDPSPVVNVWIDGPDSVRAGTSAPYTVNVAKQGIIAAGFNVAGYFGSLSIADSSGTQLERESSTDSLELTHTLSRFAAGSDTISWTFMYTAPLTVGLVDTLFSAGNAVNNDTLPDGDFWNYGNTFLVRVTGTTSVKAKPVADGYRLLQNYPNPFNPSTNIRYAIAVEGKVTLTVFDAAGKEVGVLVDEMQSSGHHEVAFNAGSFHQLASGIYLCRISVRDSQNSVVQQFSDVKKMVLLK